MLQLNGCLLLLFIYNTHLLLNIVEWVKERTVMISTMATDSEGELMSYAALYWCRLCVLIKSAVDSQLRCGSAGAAWCSSEATGGLDPSRRASSWPWQEPRPSFLSPRPPRPHLHPSRRMSCPHRFPPPAGTPAETVGIKQCVGDIRSSMYLLKSTKAVYEKHYHETSLCFYKYILPNGCSCLSPHASQFTTITMFNTAWKMAQFVTSRSWENTVSRQVGRRMIKRKKSPSWECWKRKITIGRFQFVPLHTHNGRTGRI